MRTWLTGVGAGLMYGVLFGLSVRYLMSENWTTAVVAGAVTAPAFGISIAVIYQRWQRMVSSLDGNLTRKQRRTVWRASRRGPVPADPALRAAALAGARRQLERYRPRWLRVALVAGPICLVLSTALTVLDDDREWWSVVLRLAGTALLIWTAFEPRRLRRRIEVLSAVD